VGSRHQAGYDPSRLGTLGLLQERIDLGPECPAGFSLVVGELGQRGRVAQAGEVNVGFPVLKRP